MRVIKVGSADPIPLGYRGERDVTQVVFDLTDFIKTFGEGVAQLTVRRSGDPKEYAAAIEQNGNTAVWTVGAEWTAVDGSGYCQLSWYVGDRLAKSVTYKTRVQASMGESNETAPEPQAGYLAQVQAAGAQAVAADKHVTQVAATVTETARRFDAVAEETMENMEAAGKKAEDAAEQAEDYATHPPEIGENGNWYRWDGEKYVDTGIAVQEAEAGKDGGYYSPSVTQPDASTMRVSYTASQSDMPSVAPVTVVLPAGPAGKDGAAGKDGQKGDKGDTGAAGKDGADGKTPVKGVDYYTDADKQEMVDLVLAALPNGDEVEY